MDETLIAGALVLGALLLGSRSARAAPSPEHTSAKPAPVAAGGEQAARYAVMGIARAELDLGICEDPDGSNTSTSPNGGIAKYGMPPDFWCMRFVKWVFNEAADRGADIPLLDDLEGGGSVMRTKDSAEELGIYTSIRDPFWNPQPGDILILSRDGAGTGHTGIIYGVVRDASGRITALRVIEGNTDNCVKLRFRRIGEDPILGSINPYASGPEQ